MDELVIIEGEYVIDSSYPWIVRTEDGMKLANFKSSHCALGDAQLFRGISK